ncbi:MAG: hypothetical protein JNJ48_07035 [Phycisphaerae bacterium]|nr:hypothetical protein [Phycisphaerae bacterium]
MSGAEAGHHDQPASLQGTAVDLSAMDEASRAAVLEKAFDFRGDVTLGLADGRTVTGYLFDRRPGKDLASSVARLLPPDSEQRLTVPYAQIVRVEFGKDAAHGKSFETWVKKYVEKKLKGESASIESEAL